MKQTSECTAPNRQDEDAARYYRGGRTVAEIARMQNRTEKAVEESIILVTLARHKAAS